MTNKYALIKCTHHGLRQISLARVANFRKQAIKHSTNNNRSPDDYTGAEKIVKDALIEKCHYIVGLDIFHNNKVSCTDTKGRKYNLWFDFVIPCRRLIIEVSPEMFHNTPKKKMIESRKINFAHQHGYNIVILGTKELAKIDKTNILEIIYNKLG